MPWEFRIFFPATFSSLPAPALLAVAALLGQPPDFPSAKQPKPRVDDYAAGLPSHLGLKLRAGNAERG